MATTGIIDEIKDTFKHGSMLTRIIYINLGVFLAVKIVDIILFLFNIGSSNMLVDWMAVPADMQQLAHKPWTVFTYMFLHQGFIHILFNMLWLFWLGKIFLEYLTGKQLLSVYLLGGIAGATLYVAAFNIFPVFNQQISVSIALGASAAVLAIVVATAVYVPNYTVYLLFLGPVKLKYIALVSFVLDFIFLMDGNAGGHIAHIGGALFGYIYSAQLKQGADISKGFSKLTTALGNIIIRKKKLKVAYKRNETDLDYNKRKNVEQKDIDKILEKIAKSGYEALSKTEKDILFRQSRNN